MSAKKGPFLADGAKGNNQVYFIDVQHIVIYRQRIAGRLFAHHLLTPERLGCLRFLV